MAKKNTKTTAIIKKIEEAKKLLQSAGLPIDSMNVRRCERVAMAFLALADLKPKTPWNKAKVWGINNSKFALSSRDIIKYWNSHYGENLADSGYDDIRRQDLKILILSGIAYKSVENPNASTNDPNRKYAISTEASLLLTEFGQKNWDKLLSEFLSKKGIYRDRLYHSRKIEKLPIRLPDGIILELSVGQHNEIQKNIIEEFLPRFAPSSEVLYLGDASNKFLHVETQKLKKLGIKKPEHDMLPDVLAFHAQKNWLFLIEAVHSSNPITATRYIELEEYFNTCSVPCIYVSAFATRKDFRRFISDISWETEVWIADEPDHMIHFNGEKFMGPYI